MRKLICLIVLSLCAWEIWAQALFEVVDPRILSFEESPAPFEVLSAAPAATSVVPFMPPAKSARVASGAPSAASAASGTSDDSRLTTSGEHFKHGARSARWEWTRDGAQLRIAAPIGYLGQNPDPRETSVSTFVFWLYAPQPLSGTLRFEFRKQGRTCSWFDYGLGFTGWRGAWIAFDRDMQGRPEEGMDELIVTVDGSPAGVVFFDHLILSSFQDVRYHTADFQAPYVNAETTSHWLVLLQSWRYPLSVSVAVSGASAPDATGLAVPVAAGLTVTAPDASAPDSAGVLTDVVRRDMATVESRLRDLLLEGRKPRKIDDLRRKFAAYGITENPDGTLRGKPIWFVRYAETYINIGHPDVARLFTDNGQTLRACNDFLFDLAVSYNRTEDRVVRGELARMYVLTTRHLLDQGFAAGSAQGTLHHLGYSMRNFYTAPVLMREVLREAGLEHDVQQAMEWFSGVGEVKLPPEVPGMDIDAFNTSLMGRLASIVMLPETPEKTVWLTCFSRWVDNGLKITEGTSPTLKSDGTVFHHRHHYPAYAVGGFDGAVNAVWLLSRTGFRVSAESHANLKRALLEMRFYCNLRSFPLALSGRHPDGRGELVPWHYARLAMAGVPDAPDFEPVAMPVPDVTSAIASDLVVAGTPDAVQTADSELAAAYLRLADGENVFTRAFAAQGFVPEPSPEGHRTYGYNASASHRRGDWLVTVAGHSRYVWSAEIYQNANHYGRYLTHGSLQLLGDGDPVGSFGSGFRQQGWDWCHIPGTTTLEIPMERMKADIRNVDTVSGYEEMLLSDEAFAGGVSHRGENGLFAMKLHEHDKYNGSLRALKSFFFFDNRIVALGSDIENAAPGGVHTTLFQNHLERPTDTTWVDGARITQFPWRTELYGGVLRDNLRNAYFVPQGRVVVSRERQQSLDEETDAPTEGDFEKAYIDHGGVIRSGEYEYMMIVHASEEEVTDFTKQLPYEVLRRDSRAHILYDRPTKTTAYALFRAGGVDEESEGLNQRSKDRLDRGLLTEVSLPSLVMISGDEQELTVSVSDPDLRFYEGPSDEVFDADGKRIERSIYSRDWIDTPSKASELRLTIRGRWQLAADSPWCRAESSGPNTRLIFSCREAATREVRLRRT